VRIGRTPYSTKPCAGKELSANLIDGGRMNEPGHSRSGAPVGVTADPTRPATMHGRSNEVETLVAALSPDGPRRAVVHGPPGVGKTAVVGAAADRLRAVYPDRVGLPVHGSPGLRRGLAGHLGLAEPHDLARIAEAVADDRLLVVVDPPDGAGPTVRGAARRLVEDLDRLVDACRGVAVALAARRSPGWPGAVDVTLGPLPTPRRGESVDALRQNPAVALVLDHMALVDPTLEATDEVVSAVADVCRAIGGLPHALELAAARTHGIGVSELAATLGGGGGLVLLSPRRGRARETTGLRTALELSYATLPRSAQRVLRQASVLRGPFDLPTLHAVTHLPPDELVDGLDALNDLHLAAPQPPLSMTSVAPTPPTTAATGASTATAATATTATTATTAAATTARLAVEPIMAELGVDLLDLAGERDAVLARHAAHFTALARRTAGLCADAHEAEALDLLEPATADLAAALAWLQSRGDERGALRLAVDLSPLGPSVGEREILHDVIEDHLRAVANTATAADDPLLADAEICSAALALDGIDGFEGDRGPAADGGADGAHGAPGRASATQSARAMRRLLSGIARARHLEERLTLLRGLDVVARTVTVHRDLILAHRSVVEGLTVAERVGHERWLARFEAWRAMLHHQAHEYAAAAELGTAALQRGVRAGDTAAVLRAGILLRTLPPGHAGPDVPTLEDLLGLAERAHDATARSLVLGQLATQAFNAGEPADAARWTVLRLQHIARAGTWAAVGYSFMTMSRVAALLDEPERAARFHGAATPMLARLLIGLAPAQRQGYETAVAALRERLGAREYDDAVAAGARLGVPVAYLEVLAYAREVAGTSGPTSEPADRTGAFAARDEQQVPDPATGAETRRAGERVPAGVTALSARERRVLALVAEGRPTSQIALALHADVGGVLDETMAVYRKLGVRGPAEAAALAVRQALV
jgi:predicted ATPase/DNA-binding CsgD family transcriptional regulator